MKVRIPVFVKILTPLILIIALSIGISGYRIYRASTQRWQSEMDRRLERVATLAAATVDVARLQQVQVPSDIEGDAYLAVADFLEQAVKMSNVEWIGIYYRKGDYVYYWVDSDDTGVGYPFFYPTAAHYAAFEDQQPHRVQYTDEFGSYYGFVAPIVVADTADSTVMGIVEASLSAEASQLLEQDTLSRVTPVLIGGSIIAIGSAILIMMLTVNQPLQHLKRGASELLSGRFGYTISRISNDEIGDLATTFNQMSLELKQLYGQLQAANRDLEARVRVRTAELREERNRLTTILQNIADALVVTDPGGRIELANPAFVQLVGHSLAEHAVLADVLPLEALNRLLAEALAQPEQVLTTNISWLALAVQDTPRVYKVVACALVERDTDEVPGVVSIFHDLTHEVEVDQMKTNFISTVTHELRTPLTSILGFAKLIQKTFKRSFGAWTPDGDERAQRAAQRIQSNLDIIVSESERLTRLINDVLDIAKIESGKVEWHIEETSIAEIIEHAVTSISALAVDKGLPLHIDVETELPPVRADRDRILQVITNLLSNAIKFSDEGAIDVSAWKFYLSEEGIPLKNGAPFLNGALSKNAEEMLPLGFEHRVKTLSPGVWLAISVRDAGIGIASEDMPKVFEKFKQVGDVMTNRPKGTGLGLSICREIVEYHGGRIWVESILGHGSTFTFVLPVLESLVYVSAVAAETQPCADESVTGEERKARILVVDDEANIRELLNQVLTDSGYGVLQAPDGVTALEIARRERPDLIIMDLMMPRLSGFDVISALRGDTDTSAIPVLILSVLEDQEKGYRLGADAYLTKPINVPSILATIENLLLRAARGEGRKKVLVIDEDASIVETVARVFEEKGYEVTRALDEHDGISKALEEHPRIIILDALLFKKNDYEVLRTLKCIDETQSAYFIVMSDQASTEEIAEALHREVDYCEDSEDLRRLIDRLEI
ncbi:MAG: response regulator [Anaerolineae bacterium]|nr:response regulator [Anaerolineae bacterium]